MAQESKLWQRVNALGGVPSNPTERAVNDMLAQVLALIEADDAEREAMPSQPMPARMASHVH